MPSIRRTAALGITLTSALALATANGTAAFAVTLQGAGHAYNDSPTTNQCLAAASNANDAHAIMWSCTSEAGQQWAEEPPNAAFANNTSYFTIKNDNGSCLAVGSGSHSAGAGVVAWSCDSTAEQDWYILRWDGQYAQIVNANSSLCLDVTGANSSVNGARVIQEGCDSSASQLWYIPSS